jgi:YgiT-type zinc finger domain-containing protein
MMKSASLCPLCSGKKEPGKTTFTVDLGFGVVVVRNVPAQVCSLCGEDWIDDDTAQELEAIIEKARVTHPVVEVTEWEEKVAA